MYKIIESALYIHEHKKKDNTSRELSTDSEFGHICEK